MQFRPMKGEKVEDKDLHLIQFPLYLSLKLDGIRCLVKDGKALTAALKPLPNKFVREYLEQPRFEGFDGELLLREKAAFNEISSAFMSRDGSPDFLYYVFDLHDMGDAPFEARREALNQVALCPRTKLLPHVLCYDLKKFQAAEDAALSAGYEGVMLRRPDLPYKFGKASVKQGHLLKRKPMREDVAILVGIEEGETNTNEAKLNERGLTTRSSAKDGKVPNGTLGRFLLRNKRFGDFKAGPGKTTAKERQEIFDTWPAKRGAFVEFSFQEMGTVDKPRLPIYQRFRDERDLEPELVQELRRLL